MTKGLQFFIYDAYFQKTLQYLPNNDNKKLSAKPMHEAF